MSTETDTVEVIYTNYRGETRRRTVRPWQIVHGANEWHPEPHWGLNCWDVEKGEARSLAMSDIKAWGKEACDAWEQSAGTGAPGEETGCE